MSKLKSMSREKVQPIIICLILVLLFIIFTCINPSFIGWTNIHAILLTAVPVGIVAIGECVAITAGYFDMAVGMVASIAGIGAATVMNKFTSVPLAILTGLVIGLVCGCISGFLVSVLHMNAFITTYATQSVYRGLIYILTEGFPIKLPAETAGAYTKWGQMKVFGQIQFPIIVLILLYILVWLFLKYRKLGRSIYLVGGNAKCAHISGINVTAVQVFVFLLSDVLAAIAGMLYGMRVSSAPAFMGETLCLEAIASSIVGGTAMSGGKSNLATTFVGVVIVFVVKNGLIMTGLPDFYQYIAIGLILFVAVAFQVERKKN